MWNDHKPLETLIVLRRSRFRRGSTHPAYCKSSRVGVVVLQHDDLATTAILSRHGDPELQSRLVDGLIVFGLIDVPASNRQEKVHV